MQRGLLAANGKRRGRYCEASPHLSKIGRVAYEPFVEEDPCELMAYWPCLKRVGKESWREDLDRHGKGEAQPNGRLG